MFFRISMFLQDGGIIFDRSDLLVTSCVDTILGTLRSTTRQAPRRGVQYVRIRKSFLKFDYCNNRLMLVLVTANSFVR